MSRLYVLTKGETGYVREALRRHASVCRAIIGGDPDRVAEIDQLAEMVANAAVITVRTADKPRKGKP